MIVIMHKDGSIEHPVYFGRKDFQGVTIVISTIRVGARQDIVGSVLLTQQGDDLEISSIGISPWYQRCRLGSIAVDWVVELAQELGYPRIVGRCNQTNRGFWRKLGFDIDADDNISLCIPTERVDEAVALKSSLMPSSRSEERLHAKFMRHFDPTTA